MPRKGGEGRWAPGFGGDDADSQPGRLGDIYLPSDDTHPLTTFIFVLSPEPLLTLPACLPACLPLRVTMSDDEELEGPLPPI